MPGRRKYALEQLEKHEPFEHKVFTSSDTLRYLWHYAISRFVSPWAVLANVLAYTAAALEPTVQTPAIIGGRGSLNLLVGLVGSPGAGKGASQAVARDLIRFKQCAFGVDIRELPLGSGQGIAQTFVPPVKQDDDAVQLTRALFTATEIDTLAASTQQRGSTVMSVLRQVWSGENPGSTNASRETTRNVPAHSYRAVLLCGIQPERSGALLNEGELAGGTPQRWLWANVAKYPGDERIPGDNPRGGIPVYTPAGEHTGGVDPGEPDLYVHGGDGALVVRLPKKLASTSPFVIEVPTVVEEETRAMYFRNMRNDDGNLNSHRNMTRIKVGCLLAILNGRAAMNEDDWHVAGMIMRMSDAARQRCEQALQAASTRAKTQRIIDDDESRERAGRERTLNWARGWVNRGRFEEAITNTAVRNAAESKYRNFVDDVLEQLLAERWLERREVMTIIDGEEAQARDKYGPVWQYRKIGG